MTPPGKIKKSSVELLCQCLKTRAMDLSRRIINELKKKISDAVYGREDGKNLGMFVVKMRAYAVIVKHKIVIMKTSKLS